VPDVPGKQLTPKHVTACGNIYEVLDRNIRLRPGMWVHNGSLRELMTILIGYSVALDVHDAPEDFDLGPVGPFAQWLQSTRGWSMSLGWADAIERRAQDGETALDTFFRLLDECRAQKTDPQPAA
jgi:hypothetical protein